MRPLRHLAHALAASACCLLTPPALAQADKAIAVDPVQAADHIGDRRFALVVGIDDYLDDQIPDLTLCERDARAVHALVTDPRTGGVDPADATLLLGDQATTRNIRVALARLRSIPADATVFVYFSGHGAQAGDEAYWVTQDAALDVLAGTAITNTEVRSFLDRIPAERVVVMIDACYAAATVKGGKNVAAGFDRVLQSFTGQGRAFLSAAGSGEEAIEAADLKHSVFTHYLLQGLRGQADVVSGNADGVIVLPELTTYVDRHVADQARVRGGIQRPVVSMEVQEPAKFRLTIDADVIQRNLRETAESKARKAQRLATLESLYLDEALTRDQAQQGLALLRADPSKLDANDRKRLAYFQQVADGTLAPTRLQRALDLIETPEQRAVRLAEEARERLRLEREAAAREREAKIADLLASAKNNDSKANGRTAIQTLDELLKLDPNNAQAKQLKKKIERYYETPAQRAARERQEKIAELLASARSNDSKATGRSALRALDDLLRLDPNHREAKRLKDKIAAYYGPSKIGESLTNSLGMKLTYIPAGEFMMGSPGGEEGRGDDETQHRVRLTKPFLLGTTEVTQGQWRSVMGDNPSKFKGDVLPVESVSHDEAVEFCRRLSQKEGNRYRLPTEAEWEYACRAGTTTPFSFGRTISTDQANYNGIGTYGTGRQGVYRVKTTPTGSFQPNAWGLYDMHGNVFEWCGDWHGDYPVGISTNPQGPNSGDQRVLRGGSWFHHPSYGRSAYRGRYTPLSRYYNTGFRVALDVE